MVLVNGAEGIGSGWSTNVPCYNPREIAQCILNKLENPLSYEFPLSFIPF